MRMTQIRGFMCSHNQELIRMPCNHSNQLCCAVCVNRLANNGRRFITT